MHFFDTSENGYVKNHVCDLMARESSEQLILAVTNATKGNTRLCSGFELIKCEDQLFLFN